MELQEIEQLLKDFIEEYNDLAVEKIAERLFRVHRGNLHNIIREWSAELDRQVTSVKTTE